MHRLLCCFVTTLLALPALAAEPRGAQVTAFDQGNVKVQEYRLRGQLYKVTVIPRHGQPYDLVRADGSSGNFVRADQPALQIPQWTLFKW